MAAITLSDLNNYMKNLPSGAIVPEEMEWKQVPLFNALKGMIDREAFKGSYIEVLVKTAVGGAAQAFAENVAIPSGYAPAYAKQLIGLKEIIANAERADDDYELEQGLHILDQEVRAMKQERTARSGARYVAGVKLKLHEAHDEKNGAQRTYHVYPTTA